MDFITEPARKTRVIKRVDVVVIGAGPAGFGAVVAAARNGAETLLVERYAFPGGMLTAGLVRWLPIDKLTPLKAYRETRPLQGGVIRDLLERLMDVGGTLNPDDAFHTELGFDAYFPTDPEITKVIMFEMIKEAKAEILLHSLFTDVVKDGNQVKGVIIESKSGRQVILTDMVVDASGDGDVAAAAGAEYEKYPKPLMMSLNFFMANVDIERAIKYAQPEGRQEFDQLVAEATKKGELGIVAKSVLPDRPVEMLPPMLILDPERLPANWRRRGEAGGWAESVAGDGTNVQDLTNAEITARKTLLPITNFYRKYVPGYENAYLAYTGTQIGIRESRRIVGGYWLTADKDIREGLKHIDVIAKSRAGSAYDLAAYTPEDAPIFDIPYRCIVPKVIDGLLVAGRCISIDHNAATFLSPRDVSTCMVLGQAAGTAAALALRRKVQARDLEVSLLQKTLREQGANI